MARILNVSYRRFYEDVRSKKIILWGAGRLASYYIQTFCKGLDIIFIVDKEQKLWGTTLKVNETEYLIVSEEALFFKIKESTEFKNEIAIFITPTSYAGVIIEHINKIKLLNELPCYVGVLMRDKYERIPFTFSEGEDKIPKKIHYCWFGGKAIPGHLKKYIEGWYKLCPEYEIIRWDESNYDISKNRYMMEAYECEKWGFVPDYARLDIIYNEGGIYLDTDVELLQPPDRLLKDEMFCGFQCNFQINFGCGFGAVKKHSLIKKLRDYYENLSFYLNTGQMNLKACYEYQHPVLVEAGFLLENCYQNINSMVIYPSEVLAPSMGLISDNLTSNSISMHHLEYSWASKKEKDIFLRFKANVRNLITDTGYN